MNENNGNQDIGRKKGHSDPQPEHGKDKHSKRKKQRGRRRAPGKSHALFHE